MVAEQAGKDTGLCDIICTMGVHGRCWQFRRSAFLQLLHWGRWSQTSISAVGHCCAVSVEDVTPPGLFLSVYLVGCELMNCLRQVVCCRMQERLALRQLARDLDAG